LGGHYFALVVGDKGHKCPRIVAKFLWPRISLFHSAGRSIAEYVVGTRRLNGKLNLFMLLGLGSIISVAMTSRGFVFLSLSRELGNPDLHISHMADFEHDFILSQLGENSLVILHRFYLLVGSSKTASQLSGFAGISTNCASSRLIARSSAILNPGWLRLSWMV
jgi:hypothetical protein